MTVHGPAGGSVTVTAVPAQPAPDELAEAAGPVTGFIITTQTGSKVYVSGDTIPFSGTQEMKIASRTVTLRSGETATFEASAGA